MISENIAQIRQRISAACARTGREPTEVTLLAVSKSFPAEFIREAVGGGVEDIGENYVQELLQKRSQLAGEKIRWHFIGHLQSNKVKYIADWVTLIHSVDSTGVAREINRQALKAGRRVDILVEVNTTAEGSKFGIAPSGTESFIRELAPFEALSVCGLMTIGPFLPDPEASRPMFRQLRELGDRIGGLGQANVAMRHLSMGMTTDFETAIEEGSTIVRVGTAIFGARRKPL